MYACLDLLEKNVQEDLIETSKEYNDKEFYRFTAEVGWQDWMSMFTEASDGEICSESETEAIQSVLEEVWNKTHAE